GALGGGKALHVPVRGARARPARADPRRRRRRRARGGDSRRLGRSRRPLLRPALGRDIRPGEGRDVVHRRLSCGIKPTYCGGPVNRTSEVCMSSLVRGLALAATLALIVAAGAGATQRTSAAVPGFGPHVKVSDPSMTTPPRR